MVVTEAMIIVTTRSFIRSQRFVIYGERNSLTILIPENSLRSKYYPMGEEYICVPDVQHIRNIPQTYFAHL